MIPLTVSPASGNGAATTFAVSGLPSGFQSSDFLLLVDRLFQVPTTDYTFTATSTTTGSFTTTYVPANGAVISAYANTTVAITIVSGSGNTVGTTTLGTIRTAAQQRADMVNSSFVTDPEWNSYINSSAQELYDLIVQKYGNDYYSSTPYQFTTDGTSELYGLPDGTNTYLLPSGSIAPAFYKGLGVEVQVNGSSSNWVTLKPFPFIERNRFSVPGVQVAYGLRGRLKYRFNGNSLWLKPVPVAGQVVRLWYVPRFTLLVSDSDTLDGVSGWEEYVIVDAAAKALVKEESIEQAAVFLQQKHELAARIESAAENRDAGSPMVVGDARGLMGRRGWQGGSTDDDAEAW